MAKKTRVLANRTGTAAAKNAPEDMIAATREFPPSSAGSALALGEVRVAYATDGERGTPVGSSLLLDKLGERLAFERAGARLYEALLSKHRAYGSFEGGPGEPDLLHILGEEYEHIDLLARCIVDLGGDPTELTRSANVALNISAGLPQVLSDPRTNLHESLEAIVVAELADNECWSTLGTLASQAGQDELAERARVALEHEREHLENVRRWLAAGRTGDGVMTHDEAGDPDASQDPADAADGEEFTFTENSPTDPEGFVVSEEEAREDPEAAGDGSTGADGGEKRPRRRRPAA